MVLLHILQHTSNSSVACIHIYEELLMQPWVSQDGCLQNDSFRDGKAASADEDYWKACSSSTILVSSFVTSVNPSINLLW